MLGCRPRPYLATTSPRPRSQDARVIACYHLRPRDPFFSPRAWPPGVRRHRRGCGRHRLAGRRRLVGTRAASC